MLVERIGIIDNNAIFRAHSSTQLRQGNAVRPGGWSRSREQPDFFNRVATIFGQDRRDLGKSIPGGQGQGLPVVRR
jgi:hypothetical protein